MKSFGKKLVIIIAFGLLAGVILNIGHHAGIYIKQQAEKIEETKSPLDDNDVNIEGDTTPEATDVPVPVPVSARDVTAIVDAVMPAIVSVNSTIITEEQDFFGRRMEYETTGSGSGIIIGQNNNELLIVTNEHVVSGAKSVSVDLFDGASYDAEIKGSDVNADIAVLSVKLKSIPKSTKKMIRIATLGDSDQLKTGAMAIAIGNALGYGQSTTVGYISALNREVTVNDVERRLIQTDAAINPGNSGGALLNINGEVIGINSVKYASEEVESIGYAIPISEAVPIINDLMNREVLTEHEAGYLGIDGQTVTASSSIRYGIPAGVYVNQIQEGSPADEAGMKKGEVIIKVNDRTISTSEDLQTILDYTRAGKTIKITVSTLVNSEYIEKDYEVILGNRR